MATRDTGGCPPQAYVRTTTAGVVLCGMLGNRSPLHACQHHLLHLSMALGAGVPAAQSCARPTRQPSQVMQHMSALVLVPVLALAQVEPQVWLQVTPCTATVAGKMKQPRQRGLSGTTPPRLPRPSWKMAARAQSLSKAASTPTLLKARACTSWVRRPRLAAEAVLHRL